MILRTLPLGLLAAITLLFIAGDAFAQQSPMLPIPSVTFGVEAANTPQDVAITLQIIALFTVLTLAPSILMVITSFTRIIIVFHFLRTAMGTAQMPPNQILVGIALLLTFFIMTPVVNQVNQQALAPYFNNEMSFTDMVANAKKPVRTFLLANTQKKDLMLFLGLSRTERPRTVDDIPDHVLAASFVLSEIQLGFQIGFLLFLPFLIIDFVVASVLLAMGMMMLPPVMISVPFKILLFIMVDGWGLLITSLVKSYYV
ncbi:MAG: flagellar type III secretion system pore protein FliP [Deferribacteraceae bacterium]|jgi:flagellar biosynthetic protein FliP|nr:flagellar type III secretion system pore protein FliP [Deferribacteraceae bacterium]